MARYPKALIWLAESLNEYDELIQARRPVPRHALSSSAFWFNGLARELANLRNAPTWLALLTSTARSRFLRVTNPK